MLSENERLIAEALVELWNAAGIIAIFPEEKYPKQWKLRTALAEQPQLEPQEGPWRVEGGDVRSTLTNDDLSYWIEEPKIEALTLAALLNRGVAAERRVAELEAERDALCGVDCGERARAEQAERKLHELAELDVPEKPVSLLDLTERTLTREWTALHPEHKPIRQA